MANEKKNLGGLAFLPLLVFLVLYIGTGVILSIMGAENTFGAFPRHVALLCGFAVAMVLQPGDSDGAAARRLHPEEDRPLL